MSTTRRMFLQTLGTAGVVSIGCAPPAFLSRLAHAAERDDTPADGHRILVLLELSGGNDGLNTVIPYGDPAYYQARPGIGIPRANVLKLDDHLGLHPALRGLHELYDDGRLAIIQGVGYPNPDRSHFRSMDIWQSAQPDRIDTKDGWLGRALDSAGDALSTGVPAMMIGSDRLPLALVAQQTVTPLVNDLNAYRLRLGNGSETGGRRHQKVLEELAAQPVESGSELDFLRRSTKTAVASAGRLEQVAATYRPAADYPATGLGRRLKLVAQMIAADLGTRIFYVALGGFDTHADQAAAHQALLSELGSAVRAFSADLQGHRLDDRVLIATFSEFGRRVKENGSLGTDHGAASQMFVVTPTGKAGLHGAHPSLTELEQGDLKFHTDFRSVYATLLEKWLKLPSEPALGRKFRMLDFV
jgi:uncharacterized protein (DUF1501 family)